MKIITIEINILYVNSLLLTTTYYKRPRSAQIRLKLGQFSLKSDQNLSPKRFKKYKTRCRTPLLHLKYEFMVHLTILNKLTNWNELIVLLAKAGWFWTLFLKKWRNDFVKFSEKKKNVYTGILLFLTHLVQVVISALRFSQDRCHKLILSWHSSPRWSELSSWAQQMPRMVWSHVSRNQLSPDRQTL